MDENPYQSPQVESVSDSPSRHGLITLFYIWLAVVVTSMAILFVATFLGWDEDTTQLAALVADASAVVIVIWLRRAPRHSRPPGRL